MAIRCSMLGHKWSEPEVERTREQEGTTLVVAVREVRTCQRCGEREVLGEETEDAIPPGAEDADEPGEEGDEKGRPPQEEVEIESGEWPDPGRPEEPVEYEPRPWPDADPPSPDERGPDEPDVIEAAEPAGEPSERAGEPVDPAEVLSEAAEEQTSVPDDGTDPGELPLEGVEVYCPNCEFVDESPTPGLRGGDSCPQCRTSYLEERDGRANDESRKSDPDERPPMKEYKMRRGEYLDERIPDMEATVEEYFGPISDTEEFKGSELFVVEEPSNPVFERVVAGTVEYDGKKDKLAVEFTETDPTELSPEELEAAEEAVDKKNEFLLEATGRDAKARRDSMKRAVEDEPDQDFEA